jgi:hypothetical protein
MTCFWQVVKDIHAHSQVDWEGLSVSEIRSIVHGILSLGERVLCTTATAREQRGCHMGSVQCTGRGAVHSTAYRVVGNEHIFPLVV